MKNDMSAQEVMQDIKDAAQLVMAQPEKETEPQTEFYAFKVKLNLRTQTCNPPLLM